MANVAENVKNLKELMQQARLHPKLYKMHDDGTYVTFYSTVQTRVPRQIAYGFRKGEGRAWAYRNVLNYLEQLS